MTYISFKTLNSLEEFSLIGGNPYTLQFSLYDSDGITPTDLTGATINWVLCPYGQPDFLSLSVVGTITGLNTFEVYLDNADTIELSGKYTHQPIITSFSGTDYRPAQGLILVLPGITTT